MNDMKKIYALYRGNNTEEIETQKQACYNYVKLQGWEISKEFSEDNGIYEDKIDSLILIHDEALKQEKFVDIISCKKKNAVYTSANGKTVEKTYTNHSRYKDGRVKTPEGFEIIGGKTGTTYDAGYCLVLYSKNPSGDDIISIVFKADGTHNLYLLMNQILSNFAN